MKLLLLDLETAPNKCYTWGLFDQNISINQIVEPGYTLSWAAKWYKDREVFFDSIHESSPLKMTKRIHGLMDRADAVIVYNGLKFDLPILNKEFLVHGLHPPSPVKTIDLLKTCRSQFRFTSNKLDYVAQYLGLGKKVAHKGMDLWRACMDGDDKAWKKMEQYNKQDVRLLERLYDRVKPYIKGHPNAALYIDDNNPRCRHCGSKNVQGGRGESVTTTGVYMRYQCLDCGTWARGSKNLLTPEKRRATLRGV